MKKVVLIFALISFCLPKMLAQDATFAKGDKVLNLGIGLGSTYYNSYDRMVVPPISASFEVGVADNVFQKGSIGVGGYFGFSSSKYVDYWNTSHMLLGVRGNLHYPLVNKLDTYAGLLLGYHIISYNNINSAYQDYSRSASSVGWALFIGGRYYFKDNIAAMLEIGYGITYLNIGVAFKF